MRAPRLEFAQIEELGVTEQGRGCDPFLERLPLVFFMELDEDEYRSLLLGDALSFRFFGITVVAQEDIDHTDSPSSFTRKALDYADRRGAIKDFQ